MAENDKGLTDAQIYTQAVDGIFEITVASNQICGSGSNPYETRNYLIIGGFSALLTKMRLVVALNCDSSPAKLLLAHFHFKKGKP